MSGWYYRSSLDARSEKFMAYKNTKSAAPKKSTKYWTASTPVEYEKDGETQTAWTRCGTAFPTKNGGFTVLLNANPVNGKLVISEFDSEGER
jgi:hypothetical protein